ncbi:Arylsulfatase A [Paenibacillus sp. UNCCL117]|uniref:sulfatase-like hydrolase/transferase n=1 Tax=unclassified Paenibacillus TaxID=185978 RepID=UPI000884D6AC|nr:MULTISPECIES: sulfatase-like hydrolase/transferase [unclassified Paenibacillus]SDD02863.1 Arylsulfatase A [Paenibacillus sp. cl123]SFW32410.1 Arylsulfatase A [Paenibacillus sp. UNCCL117]
MNVILITLDSLNRHYLKAYGQPAGLEVSTPNLDRFAARSAVFDRHYSGSLPCMPARRELYTGTQEFLWRSWGPVEPYDLPIARAAGREGYVTQFISDQFHFFLGYSHGYYDDYHGFELVRGHELDPWKTAPLGGDDQPFLKRISYRPGSLKAFDRAAYARNVRGFSREEDFFAPRVFTCAEQWLEDNHTHDKFMLVIDSFDVHEPFHNPDSVAGMYTEEELHDPDLPVWAHSGRTDEGHGQLSERQLAFIRSQYAAKLTLTDKWLGKVLDKLDEHGLWESTMVIITSDHGHYLGERNLIGKPAYNNYNVLANIPLMIWHPEGAHQGGRVPALTATVDIYATMMEAVGHQAPQRPGHGRSLLPLLRGEADKVRDWAVYGYFGGTLNITDGSHTYHVAPDERVPLYNYSTMYMNPAAFFLPGYVPEQVESGRFLPYTDATVWKYEVRIPPEFASYRKTGYATELYDTAADPGQTNNLLDSSPELHSRMKELLRAALSELQAPPEAFARAGLAPL